MPEALIILSVLLRPYLPPLQAVQLPNGDVGVTLRSLCRMLQLDYVNQQRRITRSHSLRGALTTVTVATGGGPQEAVVLLAWAIPLWVLGIQPSRLTAAKRAIILILQHEAVPALYRAFWRADAPEAAPPQPAPEIASSDSLEARVEALETALRDEAAQRAALGRRLARSEALLAAAIERLLWFKPDPGAPTIQPQRRGPGRPRRR